ncbi:polyribonucleotide nucleotidyltransferase, partial [Candidatus Parcubacteria bacterium]
MQEQIFKGLVGGKEITIKTGKFAQSANASCLIQCGETVLLATAVMSKEVKPGMGYFPLMVDYEEKLYAAGRIKGSRFVKREGRPTDEAVLVSRFIDRAIRPLFDDRITNEVQVMVTALAFDGENDPDILGLIGASCVLHMSDIPWNGPIGAVRISKSQNDEWLINPTYQERKTTKFDLDIAGTPEKIVMIEARAKEAPEEEIYNAFQTGRQYLKEAIDLIEKVRTATGKEKKDVISPKTEEEKLKQERKEEIEKIAEEFATPLFLEA